MGSIYHEMTEQELNTGLDEAKSELREMRFSYAVAKSLQNPSRINTLKGNIARILTIKRERELGKAQIKPKTERKAKQKKKEKS